MSKINASEKSRVEVIKNATGKSYSASKNIWNAIKNKQPTHNSINLDNLDAYNCKVYYHDLKDKRTYFNLKPFSVLRYSPGSNYVSPDAIFSPFISNIIADQKIAVKLYSSHKGEYTYINEVVNILEVKNFSNDLAKELETRKLLLNDFDKDKLKPIIYYYDWAGNEFDYVSNVQYCINNIEDLAVHKIFVQLRQNKGGIHSKNLADFIRNNVNNPECISLFSEMVVFSQEDTCNIYNFNRDGNLLKAHIKSTDFMFNKPIKSYPISNDYYTVNLLEAVNGANIQWKFNSYNGSAIRVITDKSNNLNDNDVFKSLLIHCNHYNIPVNIVKSEDDLIRYADDINKYVYADDVESSIKRRKEVKNLPIEIIVVNFNKVPFDEDNEYYRDIINFADLSNVMILAFNSYIHYKNDYKYCFTIFDDTPKNLLNNSSFVREYRSAFISWNDLDYQINGNIKYIMGNVDRTLARSYTYKNNLVSNILKIVNNGVSKYALSDEYNIVNLGVKDDYMPLLWKPFSGKNIKYYKGMTLAPHMQITDPMLKNNNVESNKIYQVLLNHFNQYSDEWIMRRISAHADVIDIYAELLKRYALMKYNDVANIVDLPDNMEIKPMVVLIDTDKLNDSSFDFNNVSYIELFRLGRAPGMVMIEIGSKVYGAGEKNANIPVRLAMNISSSIGERVLSQLMSYNTVLFADKNDELNSNFYAIYGDRGSFENYEDIPPMVSELS